MHPRAVLRHALLSVLAPPLCGVCAGPCSPEAPVCEQCSRALALARPEPFVVSGVAQAAAAAPYAGAARRVVGGLKFAKRLQMAGVMASAMAALDPARQGAAIVPVPAAPARLRRRGFDPASEIAVRLAQISGCQVRGCLRRENGPRQVGRPRAQRLADPPRVKLTAPPPLRALLVDDVVTTGATLAACARALSDGGAQWVAAVAFARSSSS